MSVSTLGVLRARCACLRGNQVVDKHISRECYLSVMIDCYSVYWKNTNSPIVT